jgi:uncharacterized protein YjdB
MNRTIKKLLPIWRSFSVVCVALVGFAAIIGSGSSSSNPAIPAIIELDIEPKIAILDLGSSEPYQAIAMDASGNVSDVSDQVSWSLENESGIVELSENPDYPGKAFALAVLAGQDNIVATLGELTTRASVTVVDSVLIDLSVTPENVSLTTGGSEVLQAEGTYDDGHTQDLTDESVWSSSNEGIASVTDIGVVTGESAGNASVSALLDGLSDEAGIEVRDPVDLDFIEVSPQDVELIIEGSQQYNALAHYTDGEIRNVTKSALWISSNLNVASQDNFKKGLFNAKAEGTTEISAELGINNVGTSTLAVIRFFITDITVTPKDFSLAVGESKKYFTEAIGSDGKLYSVNQSPNQSYDTAEPSIAYISNDPENKGQLVGLKPGTTTVFSSFEYEDFVYLDETTVTVSP